MDRQKCTKLTHGGPMDRPCYVHLDRQNGRRSIGPPILRKFGPSKITTVDRNFEPSKITTVDRNFGPSKITTVDRNFGHLYTYLSFFP